MNVQRPALIVVSGPPAAGKGTLARAAGGALDLPVINRDSIRGGLAVTDGSAAGLRSPGASRAFEIFFGAVRGLLDNGVSVVAEAAFWASPGSEEIERLAEGCRSVLIRCGCAPEVWFQRFQDRMSVSERAGQPDADFVAATLSEGGPDNARYLVAPRGLPIVDVDTTEGLRPSFDHVMSAVRDAVLHG